jgi:alkanesulfonate monooxygenase SsuD/methylene tetrahydromethanopterin reductase-like flavin-dependent oxidoreductase (luciferase family)
MTDDVRVGIFAPFDLVHRGPVGAAAFLARVNDAGIDHLGCGDHVAFGNGSGFDGLVQATALAMLQPNLPVHVGVYNLAVRHPVLVARQLSDLALLAPGRVVFGVGIGGEDRREIAMCGVDPASRGRRMDECLTVLRALTAGGPVTFHGEFFDLDRAMVSPAPAPPVPIIVGGRSDVAAERAGRLGDGWLGIWNSPRRFADVVDLAAAAARSAGRPEPTRHAMQVWCGLADSKEAARARLAPAMQGFYGLPFERFERYCPYGTAQEVAEFLAAYVDAGCREFNLIPQAPDDDTLLAEVAEVRRLLRGGSGPQ